MKVKEYRLKNGYTQTEIANILNIKQNSYSNKELGKRSFTIEEIKLLKELFKVTYEDLLN
ncbi:MAG: helix-turn-helix transcriptional regulator [Terrisporobacter sp.]|uniref:helix-turn-helix transcriptional regulator n=1 Tax=Terrisporobacter sp. TaxID=1965305 RepID=UPI001B614C65|nr:helix-turn-helix transcriptional regulator [Terrisporobacter sp.]MBP3932055.1 helix-turn-helix transcriptional regulator [Peptostreptococcaceae bacterium]MDY6152945.1 helix-turn-helix transcriptional regulator [Terrisporobacter sp.]